MANVYCFQSCSLIRLDSHQPIRQPLERLDDRIQPGPAVGIQHPDQVKAHRLGDERQHRDEQSKL